MTAVHDRDARRARRSVAGRITDDAVDDVGRPSIGFDTGGETRALLPAPDHDDAVARSGNTARAAARAATTTRALRA